MSNDLSDLSLEELKELAARTRKAMQEKQVEQINMANVIPFKLKTIPEPQAGPAPDDRYFVGSINTSAEIAAYVYQDKEAAEMLLGEMRRFMTSGVSYDYLPLEVRQRCGRYLANDDDDIGKAIDVIYSVVTSGE